MILTSKFVFIHVPKTGGTFVRRVLREHAPADWQVEVRRDHPGIEDIPASHRELPRFATLRNPFSWYVSWYSWMMTADDKPYEMFEELSEGRTLPFKETILNVFARERVQALGEGPFTLWARRLLGRGLKGVRVGRMESLRTDLLVFLDSVVEPPPALRAAIAETPPVRVGEHRHYSEDYDDELRQLVWERDRAIFEFLGYRWGDGG